MRNAYSVLNSKRLSLTRTGRGYHEKHLRSFSFILYHYFCRFPDVAFSEASPAEALAEAQKQHDEWGFPHRDGIVLVLSGGGTKGLAHIGVLEILERENIPIAAIVGTSMGAVIGGIYASGYSAAEMKEIISDLDMMEIISNRSSAEAADINYNKPPSSGSAIFNVFMDEKKSRGATGHAPRQGPIFFSLMR